MRTLIEFSLSMLIREQWLYSGSGLGHYRLPNRVLSFASQVEAKDKGETHQVLVDIIDCYPNS